jgi:hypothetical protein
VEARTPVASTRIVESLFFSIFLILLVIRSFAADADLLFRDNYSAGVTNDFFLLHFVVLNMNNTEKKIVGNERCRRNEV